MLWKFKSSRTYHAREVILCSTPSIDEALLELPVHRLKHRYQIKRLRFESCPNRNHWTGDELCITFSDDSRICITTNGIMYAYGAQRGEDPDISGLWRDTSALGLLLTTWSGEQYSMSSAPALGCLPAHSYASDILLVIPRLQPSKSTGQSPFTCCTCVYGLFSYVLRRPLSSYDISN